MSEVKNGEECREGNTEIDEQGKLLHEGPADFETAIAATGFGNFNYILLLLALPTSWGSLFETTTMSYVFPAAQCDLNLSLEDKGMLNAVTYFGTIVSAFVWGFLYDTYGRRKLLMVGYLIDAVIVALSGFSPNKEFLMFMKFMGGFIVNGPYAATPTYLSELHVAKHRSRMPLLLGVGMSLGSIFLPVLAAFILPLNFKLVIADGLVLYSWGLYLLINALPSLISGIVFIFMPESPKYLMSMGRNQEALEVFRKIYSLNTGKPAETFPIKQLVEETNEKEIEKVKKSFRDSIKDGWAQIKPLFLFPHLPILLLVCSLQMFALMSLSTLRLWMPQIFQAINDFKFMRNGTSASLCEMLSVIQPSSENTTAECFVNFDNLEVYINSAAAASTLLLGHFIAGTLINAMGQNRLLQIINFLGGWVTLGIYFAPNGPSVTALLSVFVMFTGVCSNVILIVIVNLFPTTLRTMTISLAMMTGRAAAMIGNMIFPYLLKMGCGPPFFSIAGMVFACFFLSLFLPKQKKHFI